PNIVNLFEFGQYDGGYFMVMEYVEGLDLNRALDQHHVFSLEEATPMITRVAEAITYAHKKGLVHRDIKPANIMLRGDQTQISQMEPVLMDFGLAKFVDGPSFGLTTGFIGTLAYTAPEQIMASRQVDHRADIYSFGITCYQLLTGNLPFDVENEAQM